MCPPRPRRSILVTGKAGSGKSTTQACIIDQINRTRECHIITMENPIEYLHRNQRSVISQREISIDTFALLGCHPLIPDGPHPHPQLLAHGAARDDKQVRALVLHHPVQILQQFTCPGCGPACARPPM